MTNVETSAGADAGKTHHVCQNFNLYWLAGTGIAVYFLFIYTPLKVQRVDPLFLVHLIGAYSIYLACVHNAILTPTTWKEARLFHVWIGRYGYVMGVISVAIGAYLTWTRYADVLGFAIPITIGGVGQLHAQFEGYRGIRKYRQLKQQIEEQEAAGNETSELSQLRNDRDAALRTHIQNMVQLFMLACAIPATIRIAEQIGAFWAIFPIIIALVFLGRWYAASLTKDLGGTPEPKPGLVQKLSQRLGRQSAEEISA